MLVVIPDQDVARLTVQDSAYRVECGEPDSSSPPVFEDGDVGRGDANRRGEVADGHAAFN